MAKSDSEFSRQISTANLNLQIAAQELERTRLLLDIACNANYIETPLAGNVRDAALDTLLRLLRPAMQVIHTPDQEPEHEEYC